MRFRGGWTPDLPDQRDIHYAASHVSLRHIPPHSDLCETDFMPPIWDQGNLGSCVGHGVGALFDFVHKKLGSENALTFTSSRLFIYYAARMLEHAEKFDGGAMIRDGLKATASFGVCHEMTWPYLIERFATHPTPNAWDDAKHEQNRQYSRVGQNLQALRACLASGYPVVGGIVCYESLDSLIVERTGKVPLPRPNEVSEGGHCIMLCGHDDATERYKFRNSWGTAWGDKGYGYLPYAYVHNPLLAADYWTMRIIG